MMTKRFSACLLLLALIGLGGCKSMKNDIDDLKGKVDALKNPVPTALVILSSEIVAQNGSPVQVTFRVNPSNYVPTKEHIKLDVLDSEITRAAYGSSIPEYTLSDIQPAKNEQGEALTGQWLAVIDVKEGAYYSDASVALVLDYVDTQGNSVQMTSTTVALMSSKVKLTDKMVALDAFSATTFVDTSTTMAFYTPVNLVALPISEGSSTLFDLKTAQVESCELTGENAGMFDLKTDESGTKWYVGANSSIKFENGAQFVEAQVTATLRDMVSSTLVPIIRTIRFFKTGYTLPKVEYKLSEWPANNIQVIQLGEALARIGVTNDLFRRITAHSYIPSLLIPSLHPYDATGLNDGSEGYSATLRIKNSKDIDSDIKYMIEDPENDYLEQRFYIEPEPGNYLLKLSLRYTSPQSMIDQSVQPTIKATINIPVSVVP